MENTQITQLIRLAEKAYQVYLKNGKTYFHALTLFEINSCISESLLRRAEQGHTLSDFEEKLILHLIQWKNTFEYYESLWNPDYEDAFVFERFEGSFPFPSLKN